MPFNFKKYSFVHMAFIFVVCTWLSGCAANGNTPKKISCRVNDPDIATSYVGDCVSGYAEGKGKASGRDAYYGEFKAGNAHGEGVYKWGSTSAWSGQVAKGTWINDHFVSGVVKRGSGEIFEGNFKEMSLNGMGKVTWPDGEIHEGNFTNGLLNGFGYIKKSNQTMKSGMFENGHLKTSCTSSETCRAEIEAIQKLLVSGKPEEVYLAGAKFEIDSDFDQAKIYYSNVMTRFPRSPVAIKAADRQLAINDKFDKEQRELKAENSQRESQNEIYTQQKIGQKQLCIAQKTSCLAACKKPDYNYNCSSSCKSIACD